jgi:hypothetical protein
VSAVEWHPRCCDSSIPTRAQGSHLSSVFLQLDSLLPHLLFQAENLLLQRAVGRMLLN